MYNLIHVCLSKEEGALGMVEKLNALGMTALFTRVEVPTRPELDGVPPGKGYQFTLVAILGGYAVTQWRTATLCADPGLALSQIQPMFTKWVQEFVSVNANVSKTVFICGGNCSNCTLARETGLMGITCPKQLPTGSVITVSVDMEVA